LAKIFLSYAREDREIAAKLASVFESAGFAVWWDRLIEPGAEYVRDTEKELTSADIVAVVWSKHSIGSPWVRDEAGVGRDRNILFPVIIEAVEPPLGFRQFQTIDLTKWSGESSPEIAERLAALQRRFANGDDAPVAQKPAVKRLWTRQMTFAAVGLTAIASATAIFLGFARTPGAIEVPTDNPPTLSASASIAVLPFADLSAGGDQQYFSDGIAEELLNVLSAVDGLKVASRTSSFRFRKAELSATAIAEELQVRYLLEGSVRKSGDRVRITAQLIDADDDRHLWSEAYDRPLTVDNAFEIQEEIANSVVRELTPRIGPAASNMVTVTANTSSLEAYELFLKGRALFFLRGTRNLADAAQALEKAVAIDPQFARAWETLALTYSISESWDLTDRDYSRLGFEAADRAEQLDPGLSTPFAVRGLITSDLVTTGQSDDWQEALVNFDQAVIRDAKNATALFWRGQLLLMLGYFDRAISDMAQCLELDPAYGYCAKWLAYAYVLTDRDDDALALFDRNKMVVFSSDAVFAAAFARRGDNKAAKTVLSEFYSDRPELASALYRALTDPTFDDDDRREAIRRLDENPPVSGRTAARFFLGDYSIVQDHIDTSLWWYRGDTQYLKSAERKSQMRHYHLPDYWRAHGFPQQCRPIGADDFECD